MGGEKHIRRDKENQVSGTKGQAAFLGARHWRAWLGQALSTAKRNLQWKGGKEQTGGKAVPTPAGGLRREESYPVILREEIIKRGKPSGTRLLSSSDARWPVEENRSSSCRG